MIFNSIKSHAPHVIALQDEITCVRYGDLMTEINKRADDLADVSVLAIALDNGVEWVLWDLAALKCGIPCIPLPPFFTKDQVFHSLQSAGVSHILSLKGLRDTTGGNVAVTLPQGTSKITFTSGTTGTPKGVCLSQLSMENVAYGIKKMLGDEFAGTHASILPLAVLLENVAGVYASLLAGGTVRLTGLQRFGNTYENLHDHLKTTKANSAILVPEILRILMAQVAAKGGLSDLKFIAVGGSKMDAVLIENARAIGIPVYEGYGLSECASVVAMNTPKSDKIGSVGRFLPHIRARISDNEIQIRTPQFLGYIGESQPAVFPTGDLGFMDKDGFLSITGRKKNVLITSYGRNISPEWVEAALLANPAIAQVIVYGDAQPDLCAIIVPSSPNANIQNAINAVNANLPDYAQIHDFKIVPPFTVEQKTLTGTGRPRRDHILNLYIKEKKHELLRSTG